MRKTQNLILQTSPLPLSGAIFDPTCTYRYTLWREWHAAAPRVTFIMLNPSTADASKNDPTIHRCIQFAQSWGYGSLEVVNLFAYRTTTPIELQRIADPIGSKNDHYLVQAGQRAQMLILAWGNWGNLLGRDQAVLKLVNSHQSVYCLGINQSGLPRHPLYVKGTTMPYPYPKGGLYDFGF